MTFFVGENGAGESTVLEALAMGLGFGPEGGTKNVRLRTTESVSPLHEVLRLARGTPKPQDGCFLRAESFFNLATYMDEVGYLEGYCGRSAGPPERQDHPVRRLGGSEVAYEETEPYAITRDFLIHYARRVEQVLAD